MQKFVVVLLLFSSFVVQACTPCAFAQQFPDRFHFLRTYFHGAPVQAVATLCDCGGETYVAIAGFSNFDCLYPKSLEIFRLDVASGNKLVPVSIDIPNPSDYLYAVEGYCFTSYGGSTIPSFTVVGCPDENGDFLWAYDLNEDGTFVQVTKWGHEEKIKPSVLYSLAINPNICRELQGAQVAVTGKSQDNIARVYIIFISGATAPYTAETQTILEFRTDPNIGSELYKVAWLGSHESNTNCCNIPCSILSVGGKYVEGQDCVWGNIHNFIVTCDGSTNEILSNDPNYGGAITVGGSDYIVRQILWSSCCQENTLKYPYPFMLVTADHATQNGFESKVLVYWFNPRTAVFSELAYAFLPGKIFAGQFTPRCECKGVTVGGGCSDIVYPCVYNIWQLTYDCAPRYPVEMTKKAYTSFDDTVTSLAFCSEDTCDVMIVTSESKDSIDADPLCVKNNNKGEIGVFKTNFCSTPPCSPVPICERRENDNNPLRAH